jgi:hypothetical protein
VQARRLPQPSNPLLCTLQLRLLIRDSKNHDLVTPKHNEVCGAICREEHRAKSDAEATVHLCLHMTGEKLPTLTELVTKHATPASAPWPKQLYLLSSPPLPPAPVSVPAPAFATAPALPASAPTLLRSCCCCSLLLLQPQVLLIAAARCYCCYCCYFAVGATTCYADHTTAPPGLLATLPPDRLHSLPLRLVAVSAATLPLLPLVNCCHCCRSHHTAATATMLHCCHQSHLRNTVATVSLRCGHCTLLPIAVSAAAASTPANPIAVTATTATDGSMWFSH